MTQETEQNSTAKAGSAYYLANRERILARMREYRERNRDALKIKEAAKRAANRDKIKADRAVWYQQNKDRLNAKRRSLTPEEREKHNRKRREAYADGDKDRILAWVKSDRLKNPERYRAAAKRQREGHRREAILEKKREWSRKQRELNPDGRKDYFNRPDIKARKAEYDRKRRAEQGEKLKAQQLAWREQNKDRLNAYCRNKRKTNPQYAVANNMRCRINSALRAARAGKFDRSMEELLGCTVEFLMHHIEKQWLPGMTWENRGQRGAVWHIDHIIPCAAFDLTDPEQQRRCFHYSNLRPMWASDNVSKNDSVVPFPPTQLELAPVVVDAIQKA